MFIREFLTETMYSHYPSDIRTKIKRHVDTLLCQGLRATTMLLIDGKCEKGLGIDSIILWLFYKTTHNTILDHTRSTLWQLPQRTEKYIQIKRCAQEYSWFIHIFPTENQYLSVSI